MRRVVIAVIGVAVVLTGLTEAGVGQPRVPAETAKPGVLDEFTPVSPQQRLLDTRVLGGPHEGVVPAGESITLQVTGTGGVSRFATAVSLNVTVTGSTSGGGYLTIYPTGTERPSTSNLNFRNGQTVANHVITGVGDDGTIEIYAAAATHVVVDAQAFFRAPGHYKPVEPRRLLDTRTGQAVPKNSGIDLVVAGRGTGVPKDAAAVALNVTATGPTGDGYVTAYPAGETKPTTSILNYSRGATVPGMAVVKVGSQRQVSLFTGQTTHLVVDLQGYVDAEGEFVPVAPRRVADTRRGLGAAKTQVAGGSSITIEAVADTVPPADVEAVFVTITSTGSRSRGYLAAYADGADRPSTSVVNFDGADVVANSALVPVGPDGRIVVFAGGRSDVVVDVSGYVLRGVPPRTPRDVTHRDLSCPSLGTVLIGRTMTDLTFRAVLSHPSHETIAAVFRIKPGRLAPSADFGPSTSYIEAQTAPVQESDHEDGEWVNSGDVSSELKALLGSSDDLPIPTGVYTVRVVAQTWAEKLSSLEFETCYLQVG